MFPNMKRDAAEVNAMRCVRANIDKRKWHDAYRAVDELRFIRAKLLEGEQANYSTLPATVTNIAERRTARSMQRLLDAAKELS